MHSEACIRRSVLRSPPPNRCIHLENSSDRRSSFLLMLTVVSYRLKSAGVRNLSLIFSDTKYDDLGTYFHVSRIHFWLK
jgi:hypothetical protein